MNLRKRIRRKLGKFPFPAFWGPKAGLPSSEWIAKSAKWFEDKFSPHLNLVYLPHLDYNLQRYGPEGATISEDLNEIDEVVRDLVIHLEKRGVSVILLSEYGITQVDRPIHLNRLFRDAGWLSWRDELGREMIDLGNCRVFAIPDHQVAHVYLNDSSLRGEVIELLEQVAGVADVLVDDEIAAAGLDHERTGDIVVVSDEQSWFTYYYWKHDRKAPDFARCVDIHRKPGYDPVELFLDPKIWFPRLKIVGKLIRKILGFRMLMNLIPLDASLVRGSHGAIPENAEDHPLVIGHLPGQPPEAVITAEDVYSVLLARCVTDPTGPPEG